MPRRLGFWGYALEIAAMKTRKGTFCPCCLPEATTTKLVFLVLVAALFGFDQTLFYHAEFLVFVAALSLWLSFPGSLNMARRNARSD